jgi:site-specific DNA-methyltransferase (adenine-specific)
LTELWNVARRDAIAWLRSLEPESVDLVVTDPAYESLEKHRARGTTTRLESWFEIFPNVRFPDLMAELYRVLKPDTHCYVYCDQETMFVAKPIAEAAGFTFHKFLVWDKLTIGMGYHYRAQHELILFLEKGKLRLNDLGIGDVLYCQRITDGYPTEKPTRVSDVLICQSSQPGQLVIDPFTGSGSVGAAALMADRRFAGCDLSLTAVKTATDRLAALRPSRIGDAPDNNPTTKL